MGYLLIEGILDGALASTILYVVSNNINSEIVQIMQSIIDGKVSALELSLIFLILSVSIKLGSAVLKMDNKNKKKK